MLSLTVMNSNVLVVIDAVDKTSKAFDSVGAKMASVRDKANKYITRGAVVAVTALGTAMIKSAYDIDQATSTIVKGTGASGEQLNEFIGIARSVNRNVPQALGDVATVVADLNTRLNITGDELKDTTKSFLDFSRATGMESATAVKNITRLMQDWGVETKDMGKLLDQLTVAGQISGVNVEKLSETMVNYGVQLRALGFTQEQSIALFSKFEKEGVSTEKMVGGLSIALGKLASAGFDDTTEAFGELISRIENAGSVGESTRVAIEMLGMRAGPDFAMAVLEGRFAIDDYITALEGAEGKLDETARASLTAGERISMLKDKVLDSIAPNTELGASINQLLDRMGAWLDENHELIQSIGQGLVTALSLAGSAIGLMVKAVDWIIEKLANYFYFQMQVRDGIVTAWQTISNAFITAKDAIIDKALKPVIDFIDGLIRRMERSIELVNSIGGGIKSGGSKILTTVGSALNKVRNVNDAVITPKGEVISTNPRDYLIATQNPKELAGIAGGGGITINISGTFMDDRSTASRIANEIMTELKRNQRL